MPRVLPLLTALLLHAATAAVDKPCFDKENACESWAEGGECEKNKGFMSDACPEACKLCTPAPPVDEKDDPLLGRERVVMTTEYGEIVLGFYPTVAPKTVAHILKLFRMGGYDTNHVFRVDKGFVAQVQGVDGGRRAKMSKALRKEAVKNVPDEFSGTPSSKFPDVKHVRGMLSMGKFDEPNSGTSSFSMLLGSAPFLDGKYTIFGRVVAGDHVLSRLETLETKKEGIFVMPKERIEILSSAVMMSYMGQLMIEPPDAAERARAIDTKAHDAAACRKQCEIACEREL